MPSGGRDRETSNAAARAQARAAASLSLRPASIVATLARMRVTGLFALALVAGCSSSKAPEPTAAPRAAAAPRATAPAAATPRRHVALVGGLDRSACAVTSDDRLRCWGDGKASPVEITGGPKHIVQLVGQRVVTADGGVWTRQDGEWDDTKLAHVRAIAENPQFDLRYLLFADGTVHAQGERKWVPTAPPGDDDPAEVPIAGLEHIAEIVAGAWQVGTAPWSVFGCARDHAGVVRCWDEKLEPREIPGLVATQIVAGGPDAVCALDTDHRVSCWWHYYASHEPVERLFAADLAGSARLAGGAGGHGLLGSAGYVCGISADGALSCVVLQSELLQAPTLGKAERIQVPPAADLAFTTDAGYVLLRDGGVRAWGDNARGELGDGTLTDRAQPVPVVSLLDDTLPPPATGYGKEQQSDVVMDWGGLPAACKPPTTIGDVHVASAYAHVDHEQLRVFAADYRLDPDDGDPAPRGQQRLVRIGATHYGAGWKPLSIDRGSYRMSASEKGRSFELTQLGGPAPQTSEKQALAVDGDRLELTVVDATWVCGVMHLGASTVPVAARVVPPR
jgi:hypothetical protein